VDHDAGAESPGRSVAQLRERAPVAGVERCAGLDLEGCDVAGAALEDEVDFVTSVAVVVHAGVDLRPVGVLDDLHRDEVLDGAPGSNKPEVFGDPIAPGTELTYTTPRLAHDAEILGSGSANLWVSSIAPDTELQLMVSEIRPDGQEQFVANGWLRLSQRKLDRSSTPLRPVQTDLQSDVQLLSPGVPVFAHAQIEPFNHVFRAGSAIRFSIDVPATSLVGLPLPAENTVYHTPGMRSALVLGYLPDGTAHTPLAPCGALLNQPCRADTGTIPAGTLDPRRRAARRRG
jgi:hypothetical protein